MAVNLKEYFRSNPAALYTLYFLIPPAILLGYILLLKLAYPPNVFSTIAGAMTFYFFPPLGKESVIPGAITLLKGSGYTDAFLNIFVVSFSVALIDIVVALFLAWNFDLALKIPILGKWMQKVEEAGKKRMKESKWSGRLLFWGIVAFVMVPFQGSGGVAATILARLAGMEWKKTVLAISIGALGGCFIIGTISYFAADALIAATGGSAFKLVAVLVGIILLILLAFWFVSNRKYITDHIRGVKNDNRK